jgi:membrane associated rhomboid family serine protease
MKLRYNAPVVLSFAILSAAVLAFNQFAARGLVPAWFSLGGTFNPASVRCWVTLLTHCAGNTSWNALFSNFAFILLLGPMLEERYGSLRLALMIAITALTAAILNILVFKADISGAGGAVFMMILLASFANSSQGELPLSFILVLVMYLGREIAAVLDSGALGNFAHILGGFCGSLPGFFRPGKMGKRK